MQQRCRRSDSKVGRAIGGGAAALTPTCSAALPWAASLRSNTRDWAYSRQWSHFRSHSHMEQMGRIHCNVKGASGDRSASHKQTSWLNVRGTSSIARAWICLKPTGWFSPGTLRVKAKFHTQIPDPPPFNQCLQFHLFPSPCLQLALYSYKVFPVL